MSYIAMYRKYRPNSFKNVEGQKVVVTTLQNSLKSAKIAHAYLFSGPRGTGKTSVAKIFARAVNCEHSLEGDVCNKCSMCKALQEPTISDIIEIDAASNNGVDEIRDLREKARYAPSIAKYKVYIIDEVHMLTTNAFNALLKILEEPPKHIIFILATTELHKIPSTIISRCQCFEFKSISQKDITKKLNEIIKEEKLIIDPEAVELITQVGDGALRNAIGLLDQVASYADGPITKDDVYQVSGSISEEDLLKLITAIDKRKLSDAMLIVNNLLEAGKEISKLVSDLILILKDILVAKSLQSTSARFDELDKSLSQNKIFFFIKTLNDLQYDMRWTVQKKAYLEVSIMKMMDFLDKEKVNIDDKFNKLESQIQKVKQDIEKGITAEKLVEEKVSKIESKKEVKKGKPLITPKTISAMLKKSTRKHLLEFSAKFNDKVKSLKSNLTNDLIKSLTPIMKNLSSTLFTIKTETALKDIWQKNNKEKLDNLVKELSPSNTNTYVILEKDWIYLDQIIQKNFDPKTKECHLPDIDLKIYENTENEKSKIASDALKVFGENITIKK